MFPMVVEQNLANWRHSSDHFFCPACRNTISFNFSKILPPRNAAWIARLSTVLVLTDALPVVVDTVPYFFSIPMILYSLICIVL